MPISLPIEPPAALVSVSAIYACTMLVYSHGRIKTEQTVYRKEEEEKVMPYIRKKARKEEKKVGEIALQLKLAVAHM